MTVDSASAISLKRGGQGQGFFEYLRQRHGGLVFCALYTLAVCADKPEPPQRRPRLASAPDNTLQQ